MCIRKLNADFSIRNNNKCISDFRFCIFDNYSITIYNGAAIFISVILRNRRYNDFPVCICVFRSVTARIILYVYGNIRNRLIVPVGNCNRGSVLVIDCRSVGERYGYLTVSSLYNRTFNRVLFIG